MCNLYKMMWARAEAAALAKAMAPTLSAGDLGHNQPPPGAIYPDYTAPVVLKDADGQRQVRDLRWGMPSSSKAIFDATVKRATRLRAKGEVIDEVAFKELQRLEPDSGTTNVRNTTSKHWTRWLGPVHRCLVPFTSFSEPDQDLTGSKKPIWFALDESEPLAFFAGIWTPHACVRKIKTGWEEIAVYGFLTTDSADPVRPYHKKAMPVILTEPAEWDEWLSDKPWPEVAHLQRPLVDRLVVLPAG